MGKPEPLTENLAGFWSRRIDDTNRLVYAVNGNAIAIISDYTGKITRWLSSFFVEEYVGQHGWFGGRMNVAIIILRWLFGVFYVYVGSSWFVHQIIGRPWVTPPKPERATDLTNALTSSGLVDPLIAAVCVAGGLLLLFRRTAPLGIAVLAPLVFGIFLFHLVLTGGWVWGSMHLGALVILAWLHRSAFQPLWSYGATRAS